MKTPALIPLIIFTLALLCCSGGADDTPAPERKPGFFSGNTRFLEPI
jgi:hypothetical protein